MSRQKIYNFIIVVFVVLFTACGTDSKENAINSLDGDGTYSFYNATTPIIIKESGASSSCSTGTCPNTTTDTNNTQEITISVQLLIFGSVGAGEIIEMRPFDQKYGFITNSVVSTDINGRANFTYNLPENFNAIRGDDIVVEAIFYDPSQVIFDNPYGDPIKRKILLTQEFVLQFR